MPSPVWFTDLSACPGCLLPAKTAVLLRAAGGKPFLTVTSTLSVGTRSYRLETL